MCGSKGEGFGGCTKGAGMMLVRGLLRSAVLTWCCARLFFLEEGFLGADSRVQPLSYLCRCLEVCARSLFAA